MIDLCHPTNELLHRGHSEQGYESYIILIMKHEVSRTVLVTVKCWSDYQSENGTQSQRTEPGGTLSTNNDNKELSHGTNTEAAALLDLLVNAVCFSFFLSFL